MPSDRTLPWRLKPTAASSRSCPICPGDAALELHQPDLHQAGRILGICDGCGRWVLIDPRTQTVKTVSHPDWAKP